MTELSPVCQDRCSGCSAACRALLGMPNPAVPGCHTALGEVPAQCCCATNHGAAAGPSAAWGQRGAAKGSPGAGMSCEHMNSWFSGQELRTSLGWVAHAAVQGSGSAAWHLHFCFHRGLSQSLSCWLTGILHPPAERGEAVAFCTHQLKEERLWLLSVRMSGGKSSKGGVLLHWRTVFVQAQMCTNWL